MGIGDWGLGIGDWGLGLGIGANTPCPLHPSQNPNPKTPKFKILFLIINVKFNINDK